MPLHMASNAEAFPLHEVILYITNSLYGFLNVTAHCLTVARPTITHEQAANVYPIPSLDH